MQIVLRDIGEGLLSQRGLFIERISRAFVLITSSGKAKGKNITRWTSYADLYDDLFCATGFPRSR